MVKLLHIYGEMKGYDDILTLKLLCTLLMRADEESVVP